MTGSATLHHSPEVCRPLLFDLSTYDLPIDTEFALLDKRTKKNRFFPLEPRCLKTTEKVSFNIVSEGSYVNILSGQKLIESGANEVRAKREPSSGTL